MAQYLNLFCGITGLQDQEKAFLIAYKSMKIVVRLIILAVTIIDSGLRTQRLYHGKEWW